MELRIPELSLVLLIGASGSGKSTFASQHFQQTEVVSSDFCRGLVSDDENDQSATSAAFEVLHMIVAKRLQLGKLTVVDATNVRKEDRQSLIRLAREHHCLPVAILLDVGEKICRERNRTREDRNFGPHVVSRQYQALRRSLRGLKREGFRRVYRLRDPDEVNRAVILREPLWCNKKEEQGPFDIIGDVHGCFRELQDLLLKLGYRIQPQTGEEGPRFEVSHPEGRKAVFLGDLVDRGPDTPGVLRLVMDMTRSGRALCVPGNHDIKLLKKLKGKNVQVRYGLEKSLEQLEKETPEWVEKAAAFLEGLVSHYVLDGGRLVVAHAGMKESMQGRGSGGVREFALFGETTGETDERGFPIRVDWAADYRGRAAVVYGHTPVPEPRWVNNTLNIDTGCVFGGRLTALRWPEKELVSVSAEEVYADPIRPLADRGEDDGDGAGILDIRDVTGKIQVMTRLLGGLTVREEQTAAALEVISRYSVDPGWLIYIPPTMAPSATSDRPGMLEHPEEAFAYYRREGVRQVVCQEKHMGSRAVVVVCRDKETAAKRFGIRTGEAGVIYTRTGRRFFGDPVVEEAILQRLRQAWDATGLWEILKTDWFCLDGELMPWSAKAQELLQNQYAAVGASAAASLPEAVRALETAAARGVETETLLKRYRDHAQSSEYFIQAYRQYCWRVEGVEDFRFAPFHLLATEGEVHTRRDHVWHMEILDQLAEADGEILTPTSRRIIDLENPGQVSEGISWWEELTGNGGEGMVVKPRDFLVQGKKGWVQPALKCRGREYLRIIYGPDYTADEHLKRLRKRGLGAKRSLALREFSLGVEGLERFVEGQPLRRVHECSFAVLALESEPVDPRL